MSTIIPSNYAGPPLSDGAISLLTILQRYSLAPNVRDDANKTIRVFHHGENRGYINSTVLQRRGVLGYHFAKLGSPTDACPPHLADRLEDFFCDRYSCDATAIDIQIGSGSNKGKKYLRTCLQIA
jgi:hypothetical protein